METMIYVPRLPVSSQQTETNQLFSNANFQKLPKKHLNDYSIKSNQINYQSRNKTLTKVSKIHIYSYIAWKKNSAYHM